MSSKQNVFRELAVLLADLRRDYVQWQEQEIISQIRRSMPEYRQTIWRVALPFSRGDSELPDGYRERFAQLRRKAADLEQVDLGHVFTSIDIRQSIDIVRDAYASWAGDLGTHVLSNFNNQAQIVVGSPDSLASLADLHGDLDGDNIANHMPEGRPVTAVVAYYQGDESLMDGVTVYSRFRTFAGDMGLLDDSGVLRFENVQTRHALRKYTREFIEFDEIDLDGRHPLKLLSDLFDEENQAQVNELLDMALEQFLQIIASGVEREQQQN
jgi:hypothetical protein